MVVSRSYIRISASPLPSTGNTAVHPLEWIAKLTESSNDQATCDVLVTDVVGSQQERDDLQWFLEDYASRDPFDISRAQKVENMLRSFGKELARRLLLSDMFPNVTENDILAGVGSVEVVILLELKDVGDNSIHSLPWEILEDPETWKSVGRAFEKVAVERVYYPTQPKQVAEPAHVPKRRSEALNVLLVSARPQSTNDIRSNLISGPLAKVISNLPKNCRPVNLRLVRPGTWIALEEALAAKECGFFDLVHLDVHGQVENDLSTLTFVKINRKTGKVRPEKVPSEKVAALLLQHGIRVAIVNACESAKVSLSGALTGNLAEIFVRHGFHAVVSMSFKAMDSTMELFMSTLYRSLFLRHKTLTTAVCEARKDLRQTPERKAGLGRRVDLLDYIVPVLYSTHHADVHFYDLPPYPFSFRMLTQRLQHQPIELVDMIGRDNDIAHVESLTSACPIIFIKGVGGVGKTTFVRHLVWWWKATGMVEHAIYIDFADIGQGLPIQNTSDLMDSISDQLLELGHGCSGNAALEQVQEFFSKDKCLLVLDSVEITQTKTGVHSVNDSEQAKIKSFLESLVDKGESVILLVSRSKTAFGYNGVDDVVSHTLHGLPIVHSLALAEEVVSKDGTTSLSRFVHDNESHVFLEFIVQVLEGNPLAIELVFPILRQPDLLPKKVFTKLLTGRIPIEESHESRRRFVNETFDYALEAHDRALRVKELFSSPIFLEPFTSVFSRDLRGYHYFMVIQWMEGPVLQQIPNFLDMCSRRQLVDVAEKILDMKDTTKHYEHLLATATELGLISPIDPNPDSNEYLGAEHFSIHPIFTLVLRNVTSATSEKTKEAIKAFIQFHIWRDICSASKAMEMVPRHLWEKLIIDGLKIHGQWNFIAAFIHARKMNDPKEEILSRSVTSSVLLLIPVSTNIKKLPELGVALRPYLLEEVTRHLALKEDAMKYESVMYAILKLVLCIASASTLDMEEILKTSLSIASTYISTGRELSPRAEITFVELSLMQAEMAIDTDRGQAVVLYEQLLQYEPSTPRNDPLFPPIMRVFLRSLSHWRGIVDGLPSVDAKDGKSGISLSSAIKSASKLSSEQREQAWSAAPEKSLFLEGRHQEKIASFSPTVRYILSAPGFTSFLDLAPDKQARETYLPKALAEMQLSDTWAAIDGRVLLLQEDLEGAKQSLHSLLDRLLNTNNNWPLKCLLHQGLFKVAWKEGKWETALQHLEDMRVLAGTELGWLIWFWHAICWDELGDVGMTGQCALKALKSARSKEELREEMKCICSLVELKSVKMFMFDELREDWVLEVNQITLYFRLLEIAYSLGEGEGDMQDGRWFGRMIKAAVRYWKITAGKTVEKREAKVSNAKENFFSTLRMCMDAVEVFSGQEDDATIMKMLKEAERCVFLPKMVVLDLLRDSEWANNILDKRFPEARRAQKEFELELVLAFRKLLDFVETGGESS